MTAPQATHRAPPLSERLANWLALLALLALGIVGPFADTEPTRAAHGARPDTVAAAPPAATPLRCTRRPARPESAAVAPVLGAGVPFLSHR
jgi:hypothetical protein